MDKTKRYLLIILLISLFLRIGYVLTLEYNFLFPDSIRYHEIAIDLYQGKGYNSAFTAPLYPLFLAGVYSIFGDSHFIVVRLVQAIIGMLSVLIIYLIGKEIFSEKVGLIASLIASIYPFFIFFAGLLLTETLFIFLFLSLIYFLQKNIGGEKPIYIVPTGILFGLSILIKPLMAHFLIFTFFVLFFVFKHKKIVIKNFILIFIMAGLVIFPWILRNYCQFSEFIPLTTAGGMTFYESNNPYATGGPGVDNIVWTAEMKRMNEVELDRYFKKEAVKFILSHPKKFLKLSAIKLIRFWSLTLNAKEYSNFFYNAISMLSYGPVLLLAILGIITSRRIWYEVIILYLPIIFFLLVHIVILGSIRYRIPIDPYLILFASYWLVTLRKRARGINWRRLPQKFL